MKSHRPSKRTDPKDKGAGFLEFALVLPVLAILAMGLVEYGMAWMTTNDVNAAVRDAARSGSSAGAYLAADQHILQTLAATLDEDERADVQKIIVYKADGPNGKVPADCVAQWVPYGGGTPPFGVSGTCNVYNWGVLESVRAQMDGNAGSVPPSYADAAFNTKPNECDTSKWDGSWCPTSRKRDPRTNDLDYLGVYVELKTKSITNFGFGDQTIRRSTVFRLEPDYYS